MKKILNYLIIIIILLNFVILNEKYEIINFHKIPEEIKEEKNTETEISPIKEETNTKTKFPIDLSNIENETKEIVFHLNNEKMTLLIESKKTPDDRYQIKVTLNSSEILFDRISENTLGNLYKMGETFIISFKHGYDIGGSELVFYNNKGEQINSIEQKTEEKQNNYYMINYSFDDEVLTVTYTNLQQMGYFDMYGKEFNINEIDEIKKQGYDETLVIGTVYEYRYIGNNKYSEELIRTYNLNDSTDFMNI